MEKGKLIINGVDVSGSVGSAASVPYSNTNSGLEATNTQGAIDELATSVTELNSNIVSNATWKKVDVNHTFTSASSSATIEIITLPELIDCIEMIIKTDINEGHSFNDGGTDTSIQITNVIPHSDTYAQCMRFYIDFTTGLVKGNQYKKGSSTVYNTVQSIYYR